MAMEYGGLGGSIAPVMVAAATVASALPAQPHVLRGSLASQSLAAEVQNQVFQAIEQIEEVNSGDGTNIQHDSSVVIHAKRGGSIVLFIRCDGASARWPSR